MVQYSKINHCNSLYQQTKKNYNYLNRWRKIIWQNSASIHNKNFSKLGIDGNFLNLIKGIYDKLTANVILNGKGLTAFSVRSETRQGCLLLSLLFDFVPDTSQWNKPGKRIKGIQSGKKELYSIRSWHEWLWGKSQIIYKKITKTNIKFSRILEYKVNI